MTEDETNGEADTDPTTDVVKSRDISILHSLIGQGSPRSGETLLCEKLCTQVKLGMQGLAIEVDLYVLPMQGPDVVLGIQWPQKLGDESLRMKRISLNHMHVLLDSNNVYGVYELHHLSTDDGVASTVEAGTTHPDLEQLLVHFDSLFQVPTSLPPYRVIDHRIHLLPNMKPVNVKPYRYPHYQKGEIERLVKKMLDQGIIQFSQSPFSSLVLLVKKKDDSYHFFVDYRALNEVTVKDKFLIPTADEMFDELGGAAPSLCEDKFKVRIWSNHFGIPWSHNYGRWRGGGSKENSGRYIEYKPGAQNTVAYAFSRVFKDSESLTASFMHLSQPLTVFLSDLKAENSTLADLVTIHRQLDTGTAAVGFRHQEGMLIFQDRCYVGAESKLKPLLLWEFYDMPSSGHEGVKKMMVGLSAVFYWKGIRKTPLAIPTAVWEDLSMDFITGMPVSMGLTVVLVVVGQFSKYAHFDPLPTSFNAHKVAEELDDYLFLCAYEFGVKYSILFTCGDNGNERRVACIATSILRITYAKLRETLIVKSFRETFGEDICKLMLSGYEGSWAIGQLLCTAVAKRALTVTILATGAKVGSLEDLLEVLVGGRMGCEGRFEVVVLVEDEISVLDEVGVELVGLELGGVFDVLDGFGFSSRVKRRVWCNRGVEVRWIGLGWAFKWALVMDGFRRKFVDKVDSCKNTSSQNELESFLEILRLWQLQVVACVSFLLFHFVEVYRDSLFDR
ncbi:retrotransposon-related protein [Tanacetum coccineum]|uniref:Retrotransposon-related protein n=1 Tax=Tanacetum coccineum TaxID=301880 RepID=A0ABQ4Y332_9ASTR